MASLGPNFLGLGLNSSNTVEDTYCAIKDTQGPKHFKCEVGVTRRIYEVNVVGN